MEIDKSILNGITQAKSKTKLSNAGEEIFSIIKKYDLSFNEEIDLFTALFESALLATIKGTRDEIEAFEIIQRMIFNSVNNIHRLWTEKYKT